jgi:tetratricopeptide (TPR) repeat protein
MPKRRLRSSRKPRRLHNEALALLAAGRFDDALDKVSSALALAPEVAVYHRTKGHILQSRLDVRGARISYRQALNLDPRDIDSSANYELCRRIGGTRLGAASPESKYALHSLMFEQGRLHEARYMAEKLPDDKRLQHQTWAALLKRANLEGDLRLNEDGTFDLEVTRLGENGLAIIAGMPLQALKAARTGLTDLEPLRGMDLQRLDISGTRVRDLRALKGLPLEALDISNTPVDNLAPLRGMRLTELVIDHTPISDISELRGMPLHTLRMAGTRVRRIDTVAELPLRTLDAASTRVTTSPRSGNCQSPAQSGGDVYL